MTTVISALRPDLEFASPGIKLVDAENQKDAWLRQMELSQMSLLQQMGQQNTGSSGNGLGNTGADGSSERQSGHEASREGSSYGASPEPTSATLLPVHPIIAQRSAKAAEAETTPSSLTGPATATASLTETASADDSASRAPAPAAGVANQPTLSNLAAAVPAAIRATAAPTPSATPIQAPAPPQNDAVDQIAEPAQNELAASTRLSAAQAATAAEPLSNSTIQQLPATAVASPNNLASTALRTTIESAPEAKDADKESSEQQKAEPSETKNETSSQTWQKRLIHVAQDGQNLSVSIRDNALDAHQSSQIVSRLAGDAAQSGYRLRNATVNGKTLLKHPRTKAFGSRSATRTVADIATDPPEPTVPLSPSHEPQEQSHGA